MVTGCLPFSPAVLAFAFIAHRWGSQSARRFPSSSANSRLHRFGTPRQWLVILVLLTIEPSTSSEGAQQYCTDRSMLPPCRAAPCVQPLRLGHQFVSSPSHQSRSGRRCNSHLLNQCSPLKSHRGFTKQWEIGIVRCTTVGYMVLFNFAASVWQIGRWGTRCTDGARVCFIVVAFYWRSIPFRSSESLVVVT